jgi:hypothetical protein
MVWGTLLSRWMIRSTIVYSIGLNHSIKTPKIWSNLNCKMNIKVFWHRYKNATSLGDVDYHYVLICSKWLSFGVGSKASVHELSNWISIFVSNNGEVSWSMWVLLLWTSYDFPFIFCIQNCKMSMFIELSFAVYFLFYYNISNFVYVSLLLIYKSLTMKNGRTCPFTI